MFSPLLLWFIAVGSCIGFGLFICLLIEVFLVCTETGQRIHRRIFGSSRRNVQIPQIEPEQYHRNTKVWIQQSAMPPIVPSMPTNYPSRYERVEVSPDPFLRYSYSYGAIPSAPPSSPYLISGPYANG